MTGGRKVRQVFVYFPSFHSQDPDMYKLCMLRTQEVWCLTNVCVELLPLSQGSWYKLYINRAQEVHGSDFLCVCVCVCACGCFRVLP